MATRELAARDDVIRGEDLWLRGVGVFIRVLYSIHLPESQTSTSKLPRTAQSPRSQGSTASLPILPPTGFHIGQNAKPPPLPAPSTSHFSLHAPANPPFTPTLRLPNIKLSLATPPPQTQRPYTRLSPCPWHSRMTLSPFRRLWRRRTLLGGR